MKKLCIIGALILLAVVDNEIFSYIVLTALSLVLIYALANERARFYE